MSSSDKTPHSIKDFAEIKSSMRRINSLIRARSRSTISRFLIHHSSFMAQMYNKAMNIEKRKDFYYRLCQIIVFGIRFVTVISYLYFPCIWLFSLNSSHFGGVIPFTFVTLWMLIEMAFLLIYYHQYVRFNDQRPRLHHIAKSQEERVRLLRTYWKAIGDGSLDQSADGIMQHYRKTIEGWFLDVPLQELKFENLTEWMSFAFFGKDLEDMSIEEKADNRKLIKILEKEYLHFEFPPGYNEDTPGMRLNFDPLVATQRPFVFYFGVIIINWIAGIVLYYALGFKIRHEHCKSGIMIYHRRVEKMPVESDSTVEAIDKSILLSLQQMYDNSSLEDNEVKVPYVGPVEINRSERTAHPIVFIHGLGIGFAHYMFLLSGLPRDRDIYLVEMPYVCMRLDSVPPTMKDTVRAITEVLTTDGYAPATEDEFDAETNHNETSEESPEYSNLIVKYSATHSRHSALDDTAPFQSPYVERRRMTLRSASKSKDRGNLFSNSESNLVSSTNISNTNRKKEIKGACFLAHSLGTATVSWMLHDKFARRFVASTVLVDPVTFLLIMPNICASYVHPEPHSISTYISSFVLAKELHIANALSRHFNWSYNAISLEDLPGAWEEEIYDNSPVPVINRKDKKEKKILNTIILAQEDHIIPYDNVCHYYQKRASDIFYRTYGSSHFNQADKYDEINVGAFHSGISKSRRARSRSRGKGRDSFRAPCPPSAVYRSRAFDEYLSRKGIKGNSNYSAGDKSAAPCWYEWFIFDCTHGEQMLVPNFLQIIIEKVIERSSVENI